MIPVLIASLSDIKARRHRTPGRHRAINPEARFPRYEASSEADMESRPERLSPDLATAPASEDSQTDAPAAADSHTGRWGANQHQDGAA